LFDALVERVGEGGKGLIVNLDKLERVDSSGIGSLVNAAAKLAGRARFVGLDKRVGPLLAVCKLVSTLPQSASEEEAGQELGQAVAAT
jgi:anti-anti-sigma factor